MGWIIAIVLSLLIWNALKKKTDAKQVSSIKESNKDNAQPESGADRVYKKVEEIKSRANELGVPELINELYHKNIKYYPSWIEHSRDYVPSVVISAVKEVNKQEKSNGKEWERIKINLKGKEYIFDFEEHSFSVEGDYCHQGNLGLFLDNKKMLALSMSKDLDKYDSIWWVFNVDAFIESDWIKDFKELKEAIKLQEIERNKKKREDPSKIVKLKKDYGID